MRSSHCRNNSGCVDVAINDGQVEIRDTKQGLASPFLRFTPQEWEDFLLGVHAGEFELTKLTHPRR